MSWLNDYFKLFMYNIWPAKYISIVKSAVKDYALSMAGHNELAVSFKRCIFALDEACIINCLLSLF